MANQSNGWTQGPNDTEARWRESDRALKIHSFKVALGIFAALAAGSIVLMMAAHVVFLPFLTLIMGGRAAIIGWQIYGPGNSAPSRPAVAPALSWQPAPPSLASQAPQALGTAPPAAAPPPPPPPTWQPRSDVGDWSQSMPATPKPQGNPPPPPPPPASG